MYLPIIGLQCNKGEQSSERQYCILSAYININILLHLDILQGLHVGPTTDETDKSKLGDGMH